MSIVDLPSLRTAVLNWSARNNEATTEEQLDTIIQVAESRINRELNLDSMLREVEYTPLVDDDGNPEPMSSLVLPSDYNAMAKVMQDGISLTWRPQDEFTRAGVYVPQPANLKIYTILGCQLKIAAASTSTITIIYYKQFPFLASLPISEQTHAFLKQHPDLYLFGALAAFIIWDRAYEEAPTWEAQYVRIREELRVQDINARYPQDQPLIASVGLRGRQEFHGN